MSKAKYLFFFLFFLTYMTALKGYTKLLTFYPYNYYQSTLYDSLPQVALKESCYTLADQGTFFSCNPSAPEWNMNDHFFSSAFYFGNDYISLFKYQEQIRNKNYDEFIPGIISDKRNLQYNNSFSMFYRNEHWKFTFVPSKNNYFSYRIGDINPYFFLYYNKESNFSITYRTVFDQNWFIGLKTKLIYRTIIINEFSLLDAIADPNENLPEQTQKLIYFSPSITYLWQESWAPRLTLNISDVGFSGVSTNEFIPQFPFLYFGFGFSPPVHVGFLDFSLTYRYSLNQKLPVLHQLSLGNRYSYGIMNIFWNYSPENWSVGLFSELFMGRIGITYENIKQVIMTRDNIEQRADTLMLEFGLIF